MGKINLLLDNIALYLLGPLWVALICAIIIHLRKPNKGPNVWVEVGVMVVLFAVAIPVIFMPLFIGTWPYVNPAYR